MKICLKLALVIFLCHINLVNAQSIVKESSLTKNNGLFYLNSSLFTGVTYRMNESSGCILSKREILDGRTSGLIIEYFEPSDYDSRKFLDSSLLIDLNNKMKVSLDKKNATSMENKSLNDEMENFRNTRIKNASKFEKIKIKGVEGKLKGKDLVLYNDYNELVKKIDLNRNLLSAYVKEIQDLESQISKEKAKPVYKPKIFQEYFVVDNVKEGKFKKFDANGQIIEEGNYKSGKQHGEWTFHYTNGKLKGKGAFENGDGGDLGSSGIPRNGREGKWVNYYEDGVLAQESSYLRGMLHGFSREFYATGKIKKESNFKNGVFEGLQKEFYPSGNIKSESFYINGLLDGLQKEFFENGNLQKEMFVKSGKTEGSYKEFYENGKLSKEAIAKNGILHGPTKSYYESGKLQMQGNIDSTSQFKGHLFGDITMYKEDGTIQTKAYVNRDGTIIDKTPKPESNLSKTELNKTYRCKCCKSTINGIYDGVSPEGNSADNYTVEAFYKTYNSPKGKEVLAIAGYSTVYDLIRNSFGFCTMKCSRTCYE
jgi:antitoxin component YwqK of YwqJK toxin-antitoxin module